MGHLGYIVSKIEPIPYERPTLIKEMPMPALVAPTPTPTPTPKPLAALAPTPAPTPKLTPLPNPKYVAGDVIAKGPIIEEGGTNEVGLMTIIAYDKDTDEYEVNYIFRNKDGSWGYFFDEDTKCYGRGLIEGYHPTLIAHVNLSSITILKPKISPTSTSTPKTKEFTESKRCPQCFVPTAMHLIDFNGTLWWACDACGYFEKVSEQEILRKYGYRA